MKWWFHETVSMPTALPAREIMDRIRTISRPHHSLTDTLDPDHTFEDNYKIYVGKINERDFRVKRSYYTLTSRGRGRTMGLMVIGHVIASTLYLRFTVPAINLLWLLFPPLWMLVGGAYALDYFFLRGIPVFTLVAVLLVFYMYWVVLAQFRRHARQAVDDFKKALNNSFWFSDRFN
jgi:hypothetical protein